jgi:hypothetical protein
MCLGIPAKEQARHHRLFHDYSHIVDTSCEAWNFFADDKPAVASITSRDWAQVNP